MPKNDPEETLKTKLIEASERYTGLTPSQDRKAVSLCLRAVIEFMQLKNYPAEGILPLVFLQGEIGNVDEGRTSPLFSQDLPQKASRQPPKAINQIAREATYFAFIDFLKKESNMSLEQAAQFIEKYAKKHGKGLSEYKKIHNKKPNVHPYLERRKKFMRRKKQDAKEHYEIYQGVTEALTEEHNKGTPAKDLVEHMIEHL